MIDVENVSKTYRLGLTEVSALRAVRLTIAEGEFAVIAGPSGSGKSTLLNLIGALEPPTQGTIRIQGTEITRLTSKAQARWRLHTIGYVFQTFNLLPMLTAFENVEYPLSLQQRPRAERRQRVNALLEQVGLGAVSLHRPAQLSGGQRQRLAIARALAGSPALILADEPTANLDQKTGAEIIQMLKELNERHRITLLLSTHDPNIMRQAHRVIPIRDGQIQEAHS